MKKQLNIAVLGSGNGTSFRGLMTLHKTEPHPIFNVRLVLSNKPFAGILAYGEQEGLPTQTLPSKGLTREAYDKLLDSVLREYEIELLVLVGYMRILSDDFTQAWDKKIINVHPSLLPRHKGLMDLQVHEAVLANHENITGCTVHFVTDEVDGGPIVYQLSCAVNENDTTYNLKQKVQALEGEALLDAIKRISQPNE